MMIDEIIVNYLLLFIVLEVYEVQWQKAETMMGMLARMYQYYAKNIFLFFIMHPTFYFSIGLMILSEYNIYALVLFAIKTIDIVMKIVLIKQVFIDKEITAELAEALLMPLHKLMPYVGLTLYPFLVYYSLV